MPTPTITIEVGFGVDPSGDYLILDDPDRGLLDTAELGPDDGIWTDVSEWFREFEIDMGKSKGLEEFRDGRAQVVLDNRDARFDPENLSGPYVSVGETLVRPMKPLRITVDEIVQFQGFVDDWVLEYVNPDDAFVVVPASTGEKVLANVKNAQASAPDGEGELTGARVARVLDAASWPSGARDLDAGEVTCQATTLAQDMWSELESTAKTEVGALFFTKDGKVAFRDRYWLFEDARSVDVQATFGDSAAAISAGTELPYQEIVRGNDADQVRNRVTIAQVGGESYTVSDGDSQSRYLVRAFDETSLVSDDQDQSQLIADGLVFLYGDRRERVDQLAVTPRHPKAEAALWPVVLGVEFGDRWAVKRRVPGGVTVDRPVHVVGWTHRYRVSSDDWRSVFRFADATPYTGHLILDDVDLGLLDTGTLAPF